MAPFKIWISFLPLSQTWNALDYIPNLMVYWIAMVQEILLRFYLQKVSTFSISCEAVTGSIKGS